MRVSLCPYRLLVVSFEFRESVHEGILIIIDALCCLGQKLGLVELVRCVWPFWMPVVLVAIESSVRGPSLSSKERSVGLPTTLETKMSSMALLLDNEYVGPEKIEQV